MRLFRKCMNDQCVIWLAVAALCLYLPGMMWGVPHATNYERTHAWGNDDAGPLAALAEMHDTFVSPPANRNVAYPWGHYFLMACAMAPYMAWAYVTGTFSHPTSVFPFGFTDPVGAFEVLALLARSLSVLLGVAAVLGVYWGAQALWGRRTGVLAAVFTMLLYPMGYYAKLTNPDMPVLGWTSLALAATALILREGMTVRRAVWLGVFVAFAGATKDQSAGSFVLLAPVLLVGQWKYGAPDRFLGWQSKWAAPLAAVITLGIVYVLVSGILVDWTRFSQHLEKLSAVGITRALYLRHPMTWTGTVHQLQDLFGYLLDVMGPLLFLVAATGIVLSLLSDRKPLLLLLSSLGFITILIPVGMSRLHYLLPVALPLTYFAAYAVDRGLSSPVTRIPAILVCNAIVCLSLLQAVDLTYEMYQDSRYVAGEWLDRYTQAGDRVMHFGYASKLPHLRADVANVRVVYEREVLSAIAGARPEFILVIPQDMNEHRQRMEWRSGLNSVLSPFSKEFFGQLVDGSLGYRLVAKFQTPRLMPWLERPFLSYPSVNPPVQIFMREDRAGQLVRVEPWYEAPYYPAFSRVREITVDYPGDAVR